ncbi:MAG: hypothetical protein QXL97_02330 [Candidatus Aenigmatarchaeota archaeon]
MKIVEIILILIFTLLSVLALFQILYKYMIKEEFEFKVYSKTEMMLLINELVIKCFNKFKDEKNQKICFKVNYFGKDKIENREINDRLSHINIKTYVILDYIEKNNTIFFIYAEDGIYIKKTENIAI